MSLAFLLSDDVQRVGALEQREAFEALYGLYREPVRRYLYQLCGSSDLAEDLAQETFVKAYTGLLSFRGTCSAATWLFRIARNTYLNSCRRPSPGVQSCPAKLIRSCVNR